ncbi:hypothetical protein JQ584_24095 [Bradyrhizobium liaoningense]|nr:hypothetical protein [Bradyrhizobium liaoningense]
MVSVLWSLCQDSCFSLIQQLSNQQKTMSEMDEIRQQNFESFKGREVVMLIKADYGWEVSHWLASGGVAPTSAYDTPQEAAARACQLLKLTEPVKPQDWPEVESWPRKFGQ